MCLCGCYWLLSATVSPTIKRIFLAISDIGSGWDIAHAHHFTEFTLYRVEELILSDIREYWFAAPPNLFNSYPSNGKTRKL